MATVIPPPKKLGLKKGTFRLNCKNILATWPQNATTKVSVLSAIQNHFKSSLNFAIVSEEKHESGAPHLHAVIALTKKVDYRSPDCLDLLAGGKHGDYKAIRSMQKSVQYVVKDGSYVTAGIDVKSYLTATAKKKQALPKKSSLVAGLIAEGKTLEEINAFDPGYFMMNKRKIEEYAAWVSQKRMKLDLKPWVTLDSSSYSSYEDREIAEWCNNNILVDRPFKAKQLYLYGDANLGKTTFIHNLSAFCRIYYIPPYEDFYDLYNDNDYDLAVIDEFKANKSIQFLNQWLDGQPMPLKRKGTAPYLKKKNIPTILLSNSSLMSCYSKVFEESPAKFETLEIRLNAIHLTTPIMVLYSVLDMTTRTIGCGMTTSSSSVLS